MFSTRFHDTITVDYERFRDFGRISIISKAGSDIVEDTSLKWKKRVDILALRILLFFAESVDPLHTQQFGH